MNIKELAERAGLQKHDFIYMAHELDIERFAELVAAAEREACAKLCDLVAKEADDTDGLATYIGKAIRARGEK